MAVKVLKKLAFWGGKFNYGLALADGALILALTLVVTALVFMRYVLRSDLGWWGMQVTQFMLLYIAMLGGAYVLRAGGHVNVDFVVNRLPERVKGVWELVTSLMGLTYCAILTWKTWEMAWSSYVSHWTAEYPVEVPLFPVYVIMPIGAFLLCLEFLVKIGAHISSLRRADKEMAQPEGGP